MQYIPNLKNIKVNKISLKIIKKKTKQKTKVNSPKNQQLKKKK